MYVIKRKKEVFIMADKKMTKKDYFNALLEIKEVKENKAMVDFIKHELELLEKKNASKSNKQTKNQIANSELLANIIDQMTRGVRYTITDMQNDLPCCEGLTNQKVSAVIRPYVDNGKISTEEIKGRKYFYLA